ncbi:hypothetical protein JIN84_07825 [Luteolibacter yonseiensis]|uniref:LamG-like jellyroll fold domain-containing protein n=1 Tax=Luteolibacter yonseiensis TaxID=1144680 RepID=A0A934R3R3_9BACT|nr:LamG domain-containing protein [Luteolibacter yonseiensis]MBK1815518.1 hypothetical protein [Luteolibacter yonseiensis]
MKSVNTHVFPGCRSSVIRVSGAAATFAALVFIDPAHGAEVTLNAAAGAGDAINTSSYAAALNWSDGQAPSPGNTYTVPAGRSLRTTLDAATDLPFAGDSLTVSGSLVYKSGNAAANINTVTINNLTLNGGTINNASNFGAPFILAGNGIAIAGTAASTIFSNNATITVSAPVTGSGASLVLSTNNTLGRQVVLAAANTYTGNISVNGLSGVVLATTGSLAFKIGATGVNNTISGAAANVPFVFEGTFDIDLSSAGNVVGNSWTLVGVSSLAETFGGTFNISGFTENENIWTSADGKYQFLESTGVLSRINPDSDGDGMPDAWEMLHFKNLDEFAGGDPDGDLSSNLMEYQAGSDPNNAASYPDTDNDLLSDGWEMVYFNSLEQTGAGDPDGDYNSNAIEFAAGTVPNSDFSYPDTDADGVGDGINDGWEIHYFGSIAACDPEADADGDLFTNLEEFSAFPITNPIVQTSSPDNDMDGIADGWEVKYFRVGQEGLEAVTARCAPADDVDGDGFTNLMEYKANTNPLLATSFPPLAYWRFEERTTGVVPVGDNSGGNQKDTVLDSTGLGNHMMTWRDYTSPLYSTVVPFATVPLTSAANTASLNFVRDPLNLFITDNVYTTSGVELNSHVFSAFTIEASFNTNVTNAWQVVIGKTGNPIGGQPPFSLKIRATDNKLVAGIVDGAGTAKEAVSSRAITTNTWFSATVTASATELKLWIKGAADANPVLEATTAINGAFYNYAGVNSPWVVGLGKWAGADADPFGGYIDEVRISARALPPSEFLIPLVSNDADADGMDDTWETASFGGLGQTATGDFDGDGTSNLTEYRLGLVPNSGASRFAATRSAAGLISWPSAVGVKFDVQRSTTLAAGSWETVSPVAGIDGTPGTASFTDPSPPPSGAFYRVVLRP